jgi:hypothetical protein
LAAVSNNKTVIQKITMRFTQTKEEGKKTATKTPCVALQDLSGRCFTNLKGTKSKSKQIRNSARYITTYNHVRGY